MDIANIGPMQSIMSQNVQALGRRIEHKNARALGPAQLYCLGRNNLQDTIQVKRGGDNTSYAVDCRQFMNLAAELLICLLVKPSILAIDRNNTGHNFKKVYLFTGKIARLHRLHADYADQTLHVTKEDDWQGH